VRSEGCDRCLAIALGHLEVPNRIGGDVWIVVVMAPA